MCSTKLKPSASAIKSLAVTRSGNTHTHTHPVRTPGRKRVREMQTAGGNTQVILRGVGLCLSQHFRHCVGIERGTQLHQGLPAKRRREEDQRCMNNNNNTTTTTT